MGCCLCMCLSLLPLCGQLQTVGLASRFRHSQLGLELTRVYGCSRGVAVAATPGGSGPSLHPPFVPSGGVRTNVIQLRKQNAKDEYPTRAREGGHVLVPREAKKKVSRKRGNRNFIVLLVYVPNIRPSHHLHHQQFRHNLVSSMTRA